MYKDRQGNKVSQKEQQAHFKSFEKFVSIEVL